MYPTLVGRIQDNNTDGILRKNGVSSIKCRKSQIILTEGPALPQSPVPWKTRNQQRRERRTQPGSITPALPVQLRPLLPNPGQPTNPSNSKSPLNPATGKACRRCASKPSSNPSTDPTASAAIPANLSKSRVSLHPRIESLPPPHSLF